MSICVYISRSLSLSLYIYIYIYMIARLRILGCVDSCRAICSAPACRTRDYPTQRSISETLLS